MANDVVLDYLGHRCRFTEAKGRFPEPLEDARKQEFRNIKRDVGRILLELSDRLSNSHNACRSIADMASGIPDAEKPHAMMEILTSYELDTANVFWEFAGLVLAGLEQVEKDAVGTASAGGAA